MPTVGQRRIYLQHGTQVFFTNDASIDLWLIRNDELNAIHSRINHGSSIECMIPWICHENGYQSVSSSTFQFFLRFYFLEFWKLKSIHT